MAGRIRTIKPETLDDEVAAALSDTAWRLWISTWMLADDHGNVRASARYLAAMVWQDTSRLPQVAEVLGELRRAKLIALYEHNGQTYLHINGWEKHQRMDNAGKPRVPRPETGNQVVTDSFAESLGDSPKVSEVCRSTSDQRPTTTTTTNEPSKPEVPSFDFVSVYDRYPRKEGRKKGIARLTLMIKSAEKFAEFCQAVENYRAKVEAEKTEARYVKHFDSFVSCWEDYLTVEKPSAPQQPEVRRWKGAVIGVAPVERPTRTRELKA